MARQLTKHRRFVAEPVVDNQQIISKPNKAAPCVY